MAGEDLINYIPQELFSSMSSLIFILKTLGWFIIFYLIFSVVNLIINREKNKEIKQINKNLEEIKKLLSKSKK
jgi:hypothetical protein